MSVRPLLALLVGALAVAALADTPESASAGRAVCAAGNGGYAYAGHQATGKAHGVGATISAVRTPEVAAGHVAGWVGLGGPGQGPNGKDMWIQVGLASMHGLPNFLYAEITRPGRDPQFLLLEEEVPVGESRRVAVLETSRRDLWRVWVDGKPATKPVRLPGSSGRWAPIATAESWNGGEGACNRFAFRFEQVSVARGRGGSWSAFKPGHRFVDGGYTLRKLAPAAAGKGHARRLSNGGPAPYAFLAASR